MLVDDYLLLHQIFQTPFSTLFFFFFFFFFFAFLIKEKKYRPLARQKRTHYATGSCIILKRMVPVDYSYQLEKEVS